MAIINMKNVKRLVAVAGLSVCAANTAIAGEWTGAKIVDSIQVVTNAEQFYVIPVGGKWGAAGCPNAQYIIISNTPTFNVIYSQFLASKIKSIELAAFGTCLNANYFNAEQIKIK